jgi:glycosyltransferase involved in cell wall biosynthesis
MVSVIICTYNRASMLRRVLNDVSELAVPTGHKVEVVVIDNNSSDATPELLTGIKACGPFRLRWIRETKQGLSHARNRGIFEACGDWIVFTDDDVRLDQQWLAAMMAGVESVRADAAGGRVDPIWPDRLPKWVATDGPYVQPGVGLSYHLGDAPCLLGDGDALPFGCNMAFRKAVLEGDGPFQTDLGRVGSRLLSGEDTEMFERLQRAGRRIAYVPAAVVRHPVEARRLTLRYLALWRFWSAYGEGRLRREPGIERSMAGVPLYRLRNIATQSGLAIGHSFRRDFPAATFSFGKVCAGLGFVCGAWFGRAKS